MSHPTDTIGLTLDPAWRGNRDCQKCGIRHVALFADLNDQDFALIHSPIDAMQYGAGAALYGQGDAALGVFTLRSGMIKLVRYTSDGRQRIIRVLRAGDVAGLEALGSGSYDSHAVALTEVNACRIPLSVIHALSANSVRLHRTLMQKWQQTLKQADDWLAELNFGTARSRVRSLVARMRDPLDEQGQPMKDTVTLFSRVDMGAMLGLELETVSRQISAMVHEGVLQPIDRQGRCYRLMHPDQLVG